MNWEINDDKAPPPEYELSDKSLWQLPDEERLFYHKELHRIDRSEDRWKARPYLPRHLADFHRQLLERYGENITAFRVIEADFSQLNRFQLRSWMRRLWVDGYLEKYARGVYRLAEQRWRGKKNDWRGKYFGVCYQAVRKEYR